VAYFRHHLEDSSTSGMIARIQPRGMGLSTPISAQFKVGPQIKGLMVSGGKTEFGLENSHLVQIHVNEGLFNFGETQLGSLYSVPVGDIQKIDFWHLPSLQFIA